jgi:hypothetical protein
MDSVTDTAGSDRDDINRLKRAFAYNLFYKQGATTRDAS